MGGAFPFHGFHRRPCPQSCTRSSPPAATDPAAHALARPDPSPPVPGGPPSKGFSEFWTSLAFPADPGRDAFDPPLSDGCQHEAPGHDVGPPIMVQVAASHRDQTDRSRVNRPHCKILMPVVLQPHQARPRGIAPVITKTHQRHIAIAVEVAHRRGVSAAESRDPFGFEFPVAEISKPETTMVRLRPGVRILEIIPL